MSEEEKKAYFSIEELANQLGYGNIDLKYNVEMKEFKMEKEYSKELFSLLNLIKKQNKMIDLMAETMALDIMYADEDKDVQTMKEKIKEEYRKKVEND